MPTQWRRKSFHLLRMMIDIVIFSKQAASMLTFYSMMLLLCLWSQAWVLVNRSMTQSHWFLFSVVLCAHNHHTNARQKFSFQYSYIEQRTANSQQRTLHNNKATHCPKMFWMNSWIYHKFDLFSLLCFFLTPISYRESVVEHKYS